MLGYGCVARARKGIRSRGSPERRKEAGYQKTGKDANQELKAVFVLLKSQESFGSMGVKKGLFTDAL